MKIEDYKLVQVIFCASGEPIEWGFATPNENDGGESWIIQTKPCGEDEVLARLYVMKEAT